MSCIEELERYRILFALGCPFTGNGDPLTHRTPAPTFRCTVDFTMREKGI
jgi:hypothetical protein